jgi:hypothetical protein
LLNFGQQGVGGILATIEIAVGHPQILNQAAFQLSFKDLAPSDEVFLIHNGTELPLNRGEISAPFRTFMAKSPVFQGSYVIDLEEVPQDFEEIEIYIRPYSDSYPVWSLAGLEVPDEVWQNQPFKIASESSVCVLAIARSAGGNGWTVEARNLGQITDINIDDDTSLRTAGNIKEFEIIVDVSASMHGQLQDVERIPKLLASLQKLSGEINNRPIEVSYGGVKNFKMSNQDEARELHASILSDVMSMEAQSKADVEGYLNDRLEAAPSGTVFLVITDGLPYLDPDELLPLLNGKNYQIRILLLREPVGGTDIGNDPRLALQVLDLSAENPTKDLRPFI